jgi:hypothetical protein
MSLQEIFTKPLLYNTKFRRNFSKVFSYLAKIQEFVNLFKVRFHLNVALIYNTNLVDLWYIRDIDFRHIPLHTVGEIMYCKVFTLT